MLAALAATEASAPGRFQDGADAGVADAELDGGTDDTAKTDTQRAGELTMQAGKAMPVKPEDWQKKVPCLPETEEAHGGACYIRAARKPPCPPALFEKGDACFVAVAKSPRPNTTIEE